MDTAKQTSTSRFRCSYALACPTFGKRKARACLEKLSSRLQPYELTSVSWHSRELLPNGPPCVQENPPKLFLSARFPRYLTKKPTREKFPPQTIDAYRNRNMECAPGRSFFQNGTTLSMSCQMRRFYERTFAPAYALIKSR